MYLQPDVIFVLEQAGSFFGMGLLGAIAHYAKKFAYEDIQLSFTTYFFHLNPKATVLAVTTLMGAEALAFQTGIVTPSTNWQTLLGAGFMAGYAADTLNKV